MFTFIWLSDARRLSIFQSKNQFFIRYYYFDPGVFIYIKCLGEEDKKATISKHYSRELWW